MFCYCTFKYSALRQCKPIFRMIGGPNWTISGHACDVYRMMAVGRNDFLVYDSGAGEV